MVISSKPTTLDPIPGNLKKDLLTVIGSPLLDIINKSLSPGIVPTAFKIALVTPLLKRANLDSQTIIDQSQISPSCPNC